MAKKTPAGAGVRVCWAFPRAIGSGLRIRVVFKATLFAVGRLPGPRVLSLLLAQRFFLGITGMAPWVRSHRLGRVGAVTARAGHAQRPNSNTTSRFTDSVVSPGATDVSFSIMASDAIARIIGTGRGMLAPPSLMLTMRRTFRPSASA